MHCSVEQHHGAMKDFVLLYALGHLACTIIDPYVLVPRMHPLFVGLNSLENEVRRHNDSINLLAVQESHNLPDLLHVV